MKNHKNQTISPFKKRWKTSGSAFVLIIIATIAVVLGYLGLRAMGAYLIVASPIKSANAIVVLSGGDESRMAEALRLYNENYSKMIILTETGNSTKGYSNLHSFDMRIQLLANGIPSGNMLITDRVVSSTRDEALAVKNLMINRQMSSCIIVTDPYHTRRAYDIFNKTFKDTGIKISVQPVINSWYNSRTWFLKFNGWRFTLLEYLKLIADKLGIVVD